MRLLPLTINQAWQTGQHVRNLARWTGQLVRDLHYKQGQTADKKTREYFYYIDHQGQLFLDDARIKNFTSCFKEKIFLEFFFTRVKVNDTGHYEKEFPYISPCGRERNYINCDDLPVVFTRILPPKCDGQKELLTYCGAGELLTFPFQPEKIVMLPESGRVYHPGPEKMCGVGLVKSSLAIELSRYFDFTNGEGQPPTHFTWGGVRYELDNAVLPLLREEEHRKKS